jgi:hypothetical protein
MVDALRLMISSTRDIVEISDVPAASPNIGRRVGRLFLSNLATAGNQQLLREVGIDRVINLSGRELRADGIDVTNVYNIDDCELWDRDDEYVDCFVDIYNELTTLVDTELRQGRHVLINCFAGRNRSVLLIMLYYIRYRRVQPIVAKKHLKALNKQKRKIEVFENTSFNDLAVMYHSYYAVNSRNDYFIIDHDQGLA